MLVCIFQHGYQTNRMMMSFFHKGVTSFVILHTDAACCPDINIEDVVLSNMIGEAAEKYCIYAVFSALGFKGFRILVLGFRV